MLPSTALRLYSTRRQRPTPTPTAPMRAARSRCMSAALLVAFPTIAGFYLPGVAPIDYKDGELIDLKVNKLTSTKTQLPYEWYDLPFCRPAEIVYKGENLGEVMRGDRIQNSPFEIKMNVEESCKLLCKQSYTPEQTKKFSHKIGEDYRVNWIVDNLPVGSYTRIIHASPHAHEPCRLQLNWSCASLTSL
eukprot:scaffold240545_cov36-Tisochrysis_lutea.AAC.3